MNGKKKVSTLLLVLAWFCWGGSIAIEYGFQNVAAWQLGTCIAAGAYFIINAQEIAEKIKRFFE